MYSTCGLSYSSRNMCSTPLNSPVSCDVQSETLLPSGASTPVEHFLPSKRTQQNDLDLFRKKQLKIEEQKLIEFRKCMEENNKLHKETLIVMRMLLK